MEKQCPGCKEVKPVSEYHRLKKTDGTWGTQSRCKTCAKLLRRGFVAKTKIHVIEKKCSKCGVTKHRTCFNVKQRTRTGLENWCKVCISKANRERHLKDPSKRRARDRKNWASGTAYNGYYLRTYGITAADYERMLSEQGGVCFVCRGLNTKGRRLHVDHDHKTGAVRRLLCSGCNGALGHAKDDPAVLRKLADYLESFASEEVSPVQE